MDPLYTAYQHQSQNFRTEEVGDYSLSLFLRKDHLIYSLLNQDQRIMAVKEYRSKVPMEVGELLDAVLEKDEFLKQDFAGVKVICGEDTFSLVPKPFFGTQNAQGWVEKLIRDDLRLDHVDSYSLGRDDAMAVFTLPFELKRKFEFHFSKPEFQPFCKPAVEMSFELTGEGKNVILINILDDSVVITAIRNNRLVLCNTYDCQEVSDIVYYVQLVAEVTGLGQTPFEFFVTGEFEMESELLRQLRKFIPILQVPSKALRNSFDVDSEKLPAWKYAFMTY